MRRLDIRTWPLWLKFTSAIIIAVITASFLGLSATIQLSTQKNLRNLTAYVTESGSRQQAAIRAELDRALSAVQNFIANPLTIVPINSVLTNSGLQTPAEQVNALLTSYFVQNQARLFDSVAILDPAGQVVSAVTAPNTTDYFAFSDQSTTSTYLAAASLSSTERQNGIPRMLVTSRNETTTLEIYAALTTRDGNVRGYLVGIANLDIIILRHLRFIDKSVPTYSFLVTNSNLIIAQSDTLDRASLRSAGLVRALNGESGTDIYLINTNPPREVIGFYTPIVLRDRTFAFVTELDTINATISLFDLLNAISLPGFGFWILLIFLIVYGLLQLIGQPLQEISAAARGMARGDFGVTVSALGRGDEIGALAASFADMRQQVAAQIQSLSQRIDERVRDIRITQEIGRVASTELNMMRLMQSVVELIVQRLPIIYHAQIFLIDEDRDFAILQASTGEAGRQLLMRGHRLAVGSLSVVGQAAEQKQTVIANDIGESEIHRRNEFLPDTQAELAIPLLAGDVAIGVLDVQSLQRYSFDTDLINVLQTLADQVTIAIQNARLYQESVRRLQELNLNDRLALRRGWEEYINARRQSILEARAGQNTDYDFSDLRAEALATGRAAIGSPTARRTVPVVVPIILRGETLGAVEWELPQSGFTGDKVLLAEELVNRLAISLDNARLFQESHRAAERERLVNIIAAKLSSQSDIDAIMQTAVRELGQALRAPQIFIELRDQLDKDDFSSTNGH